MGQWIGKVLSGPPDAFVASQTTAVDYLIASSGEQGQLSFGEKWY